MKSDILTPEQIDQLLKAGEFDELREGRVALDGLFKAFCTLETEDFKAVHAEALTRYLNKFDKAWLTPEKATTSLSKSLFKQIASRLQKSDKELEVLEVEGFLDGIDEGLRKSWNG